MKDKCPCNSECYKNPEIICICGSNCECIADKPYPDNNCVSIYNHSNFMTDNRNFLPEYFERRQCVDCASHWFYWFKKTIAYYGGTTNPTIQFVFCSNCGKPHPIQ